MHPKKKRYNIYTFHWQRKPKVVPYGGLGVSLEQATAALDRWQERYNDQETYQDCTVLRDGNSVKLIKEGKVLLQAFYEEVKDAQEG